MQRVFERNPGNASLQFSKPAQRAKAGGTTPVTLAPQTEHRIQSDMPREGPARCIEVIDDKMAEVLRNMGGQRRLHMLNELTRSGLLMMGAAVRRRYPEWTEEQVAKELARRVRDAAN